MISERTDVLIAPRACDPKNRTYIERGRRGRSLSLDGADRDVAIVRALRVIINHVFETGVLLLGGKKKERKKKGRKKRKKGDGIKKSETRLDRRLELITPTICYVR